MSSFVIIAICKSVKSYILIVIDKVINEIASS